MAIKITPPAISVAQGNTQQFTATGVFTDGTTQDLTASATWTTLNQGVATVSNSGLATGTASGASTIVATSGSVSGISMLAVPYASPSSADFYVATNGNDTWTGTLAAPNGSNTDGPSATVTSASRAPRRSTAITSFRIKVSDSRGQPLTTYPTVRF